MTEQEKKALEEKAEKDIVNHILKPVSNAEFDRYVKDMGKLFETAHERTVHPVIERVMREGKKQNHGLHIDLPYNVGDTLYGVGLWGYCTIDHSQNPEIRNNKINFCKEYGGKHGYTCDECKFSKPTIEKFVCSDITYSYKQGLIIQGGEHQEYTPDYVFTTEVQAQVKLQEMQKNTPTKEEKTIEQLATDGRRAYYKQYREKNKQKIAENRKKFFARKAAALAEQSEESNDGQENKNEN